MRRKAEFALLKEAVELVRDLSFWLVDEYNQDQLERFLNNAEQLINEREEER